MKHFRKSFLVSISLLALLLGACSNESPVAPSLDSGSFPAGAANKAATAVGIQSATLHIFAQMTNDAPVNVHRVSAPWDEATTTWNTFGGAYAPEIVNSFAVDMAGWRTVDVTGLVADWAGGAQENFGLLLDQTGDGTPWARYSSREGANAPFLEICFLLADGEVVCESVVAIADTYIWELHPDTPRGDQIVLYSGWSPPYELEKQSLLLFEVAEIPDEPGDGCTRTQGYWKTHSEFGPAPYDAVWAMLPDGASTPFFLSGQTYHQVMWTPPAGGNAYYMLAHQYIAAQLNGLAGSDFTAAQTAFDAATELFNTRTPAQVAALRGAARAQVVALAQTLDDYNNGLIGPGHCDDDESE
ncbi:MAG: DNRLRE domain-containing protein [Candidatus Krumholzibacteria bacterium]|jgi:hypothetical protein|nr:DNRLRE domain-containing protein [Candidatus Krumholzibacteria bacterium]